MARGVLLHRAMHPLTYEAKRLHWNAVWEAIRLYRAAGEEWKEETLEDMTPARCDILQVVWDNNADDHEFRRAEGLEAGRRSMHLADVRTTLGLAGATVWKCVRRLVELEWVTLEPSKQTKRWVVVFLTDLGVHALRMAQRCAAEKSIVVNRKPRKGFNRLVDDFVRRDAEAQGAVAKKPAPPKSFRHWSEYYWWLVGHVRAMAKHFGSTAWRVYYRAAEGQTVRDEDDRWVPETPPPPRPKVPPPPPERKRPADRALAEKLRALLFSPEVASEKFPS